MIDKNRSYTEYFMIKSLPDPNEMECIDSLIATMDQGVARSQIKVICELNSREETLNEILKLKNKNTDLFVFVDDIA